MNTLDISFNRVKVGQLIFDEESERFSISYDPDWIKDGFAISPHLPLTVEASSYAAERYLRNLLPEGEGLETLSVQLSVSKSSTFGLIRGIGMDVAGAMEFGTKYPANLVLEPNLVEITPDQIRERIENYGLGALGVWNGKIRLSLAGVQAKLALFIDGEKMGFGEGALSSTHLLKFERRPKSNLIINELYCMRLAKLVGIPVPEVELRRFGQYNAILVERFDRKRESNRVIRKHVIDGCQLTNLPPQHKYERNNGSAEDVKHVRNGVSFKKLFSLITPKLFKTPAVARLSIIDWAFFNLLLSNADAHGKNISFLVDRKGIEVAPFYDMLCVAMHTAIDSPSGEQKVDQDLAMAFGDEFEVDKVRGYALCEFSEAIGVPVKLVSQRALLLCKKVEAALPLSLDETLDKEEQTFIDQLELFLKQRITELREAAEAMIDYK